MFESAQPGHDVVVIANCASGKPMAFANFTTEIVHDAKELTYSTTLAANLSGTLIAALVLALPGLFIWGLIMETIDLGDRAFTAGGLQVFLVLLVVCVYAGVTIYAKSYRERTDALKAKIDRLLLAEREQNNGTGKSPSTK
jgi:low affinity Fe/Cu permease